MTSANPTTIIPCIERCGSFASAAEQVDRTLASLAACAQSGVFPESKGMAPYGGACVEIPYAEQDVQEFRALAAICHARGYRVVARIECSQMDPSEREWAGSMASASGANGLRFVEQPAYPSARAA